MVEPLFLLLLPLLILQVVHHPYIVTSRIHSAKGDRGDVEGGGGDDDAMMVSYRKPVRMGWLFWKLASGAGRRVRIWYQENISLVLWHDEKGRKEEKDGREMQLRTISS